MCDENNTLVLWIMVASSAPGTDFGISSVGLVSRTEERDCRSALSLELSQQLPLSSSIIVLALGCKHDSVKIV